MNLFFGFSQARALSGRLEVVDLSAHAGSALAPQELLQQQLQSASVAAGLKAAAAAAAASSDAQSSSPVDAPPTAAAASQSSKPAISCNTCAGAFADAAEHRAHFKYSPQTTPTVELDHPTRPHNVPPAAFASL